MTPLPLDRVQHARLKAALRAWDELTQGSGVYDRRRQGFGPLLAKPELMNERSAVIVCDADDPVDFLFAYYGAGFGLYRDRSFVARRLSEMPDKEGMRVTAATYPEAIIARRPVAHRISGKFDGVELTYDRIIFPTCGEDGRIDRLITLSAEVQRVPVPA